MSGCRRRINITATGSGRRIHKVRRLGAPGVLNVNAGNIVTLVGAYTRQLARGTPRLSPRSINSLGHRDAWNPGDTFSWYPARCEPSYTALRTRTYRRTARRRRIGSHCNDGCAPSIIFNSPTAGGRRRQPRPPEPRARSDVVWQDGDCALCLQMTARVAASRSTHGCGWTSSMPKATRPYGRSDRPLAEQRERRRALWRMTAPVRVPPRAPSERPADWHSFTPKPLLW